MSLSTWARGFLSGGDRAGVAAPAAPERSAGGEVGVFTPAYTEAEQRTSVSLREVDLRHVVDGSLGDIHVSPRSAMSIAAFWAAVRVIAETIGSLPRHVYREDEKGNKVRATDSPLYDLIRFEPNEYMSGPVFWETLVAHAVGWGNGYGYITFENPTSPVPVSIDLLLPDRTRCCIENGRLVYKTWLNADGQGREQTLRPDQVFHLPGFGFDGLSGYSPIQLFARTLGISLATENYTSKFFQGGAAPSMIATHPQTMDPKARENFLESMTQATTGENFRKILLLQNGMTVTKWGINPQDAQLIDLAKFSVEQVARIMRVPPHKIGHLEKATFSNIEHQAIEFAQDTIRPWLVKIEGEIRRKLVPTAERRRLYVEFNLDAVVRGDLKSRYDAYAIGRQWGWLSANDVNRRENQPLIPNGDTYLEPLNMVPAGTQPDADAKAKADTKTRAMQIAGVVLDAAVRRLATKETNALRKAGADVTAAQWLGEIAERHADLVGRELDPGLDCLRVVAGRDLKPEERAGVVRAYMEAMGAHAAKLWTSRAAAELDELVDLRITSARGTLLPKLAELLSVSLLPSSAS